MSDKTIAEKLLIKPGYRVCFIHAPEGYETWLGNLPEGAMVMKELASPVDLIQLFVDDRKSLEAQLSKVKSSLSPTTILWVTYHKGTSKVKIDINRDTINAYAKTLGLEGVAMISVNEDWSALRLKIGR